VRFLYTRAALGDSTNNSGSAVRNQRALLYIIARLAADRCAIMDLWKRESTVSSRSLLNERQLHEILPLDCTS